MFPLVARFFRLGEKEKKNEKLCEELPRINEQVYPPSHSESFTNALQGMVFKLSAKEKQNHTVLQFHINRLLTADQDPGLGLHRLHLGAHPRCVAVRGSRGRLTPTVSIC